MVYDRKRTVSGSTRAGLCFYLIGSGSSTDGRIRQKSGWRIRQKSGWRMTTETRMGGMDMSDKKNECGKSAGNGLRTVIGSLFQHRRRFNQVDSVVVGDDPGSAQYFLGAGCGMLHASAPPEVCVE